MAKEIKHIREAKDLNDQRGLLDKDVNLGHHTMVNKNKSSQYIVAKSYRLPQDIEPIKELGRMDKGANWYTLHFLMPFDLVYM